MRIVILDGYTENPGDLSWEGFEKLGELKVYERTEYKNDNAQIIARAKGAAAVIINKTSLSAETIAALNPELKYIGVLATGYNVVDVGAASENNIAVCNIPTYGTTAVAQYVMALTLELCHHVGEHSNAVKKGDWSTCPDFSFWNFPLVELAGKTFGVIGFGRIGQAAAKIAAAFGMSILAYDTSNKESELAKMVSLDELLQSSDFISLHCPLFKETTNIINKQSIAKMKDGAMLINTSRGPLIDEAALCEALNSGKLAGAALDVVSEEPIKKENPLLKANNCIITPHIAWAPKESRQRLMNIAVENLEAFIKGSIQNKVN